METREKQTNLNGHVLKTGKLLTPNEWQSWLSRCSARPAFNLEGEMDRYLLEFLAIEIGLLSMIINWPFRLLVKNRFNLWFIGGATLAILGVISRGMH